MRITASGSIAGWALALLALPLALNAQNITGRVLDSRSKAPIVGGMIELRDQHGRAIQVVFTSPSGRFQVAAPGADHYLLRVAAIGYVPPAALPIVVGAIGLSIDAILVTRLDFQLPDLLSVSQQERCGRKRILSDDLFGHLVGSANTSLTIMAETVTARRASFEAISVHSLAALGARSDDTLHQHLTRWPLESIDADSIRRTGFGAISGAHGELLSQFYGPDANVLFADWFLDRHCFTLQKMKPGSDTIIVRFAPLKKGNQVDVSGELSFDAHHFTLQRLTFQGENLPRNVDRKAAGGEIRFASLPSGLMIPASWTIWGPVQGTMTCLFRPVGLNERRGAVTRVIETEAGDTTPTVVKDPLIPRKTTYDHEKCLPTPAPVIPDGGGD